MKIAFLSRYQNLISRGAETFVRELSKNLSNGNQVDIFTDEIKGDYDIVVSINGGKQSLKASLERLKKNYKLVITGQAGIGRGEIFNLAICRPDLYVALTDQMFNWAKNWAWGSRIVKIPNGVDLNKFKPDGERMKFNFKKPVILSVGALTWYKHHEKTIKAMQYVDGFLVIVGDGSEKEKLEKMGGSLKIIQANYNDLPKIYRTADLFVLPSWDREAFGIVYLEAMASGLGVVAPNDSSRSEIIGEAGILADVSDPKKYAEAINQALNLKWKEKALNQARKFSWEKIAKRYEEEFEKIL